MTKNKSKKTNKKKIKDIGNPKRQGMQVSEAIGVFERAFRRARADEVENELREMINVQVIVAESKELAEIEEDFRQKFLEGKRPRTITVPYGVFLSKTKDNVYKVDLTVIEQKARRSNDGELGVVFWEQGLTSCDHSDIVPGKTYLMLSKEVGYSEDEGLTFEGESKETTGWMEVKSKGEDRQNFGGERQTFKQHSLGIYEKARKIAEAYKPFLEKWAERLFSQEGGESKIITERLIKAITISALFHDIGKLSKAWQKDVWEKVMKEEWNENKEIIARTPKSEDKESKKKYINLPKHAPFAYPFLKNLLSKYFDEEHNTRIIDHIALASARHHSIGVMGNVEKGEFQPVQEASKVLEELLGTELTDMKGLIQEALDSATKKTKADEPPGPSEDLYFLYCLAHRLIKMADWEDAGEKEIELVELRG